jgi:hypothetical protein
LVQIWGPRYSAYVVAELDVAVFTRGRFPDDARGQQVAQDVAERLRRLLGDARMPYGKAGRALGEHPNQLRYAAPTGTVLIRWDGARPPIIWTQPQPDVDPQKARLELVCRYLRVFGPSTPNAFSKWAGISPRGGTAAFDMLASSLALVRTPMGEAWILISDAPEFVERESTTAPARFLPSGDAYILAADRELLVSDADHRRALWPPGTVHPGGLLVDGEIVGTWRRARAKLTIHLWRSLDQRARETVEAEASTIPLPGVDEPIEVQWARTP